MQDLQWIEEKVLLTELRPYERNPRTITGDQFDKLKASIQEDGYHARIKVTRDYRVIGGHQRLRALRELGYTEIAVLVPARSITDDEFKRVLIRDNHSNGVFDFDMLANDFDLEDLRGFGLHDVMNIAPMDDGAPPEAGKSMVCCPQCGNVFPTKGNKAKTDG